MWTRVVEWPRFHLSLGNNQKNIYLQLWRTWPKTLNHRPLLQKSLQTCFVNRLMWHWMMLVRGPRHLAMKSIPVLKHTTNLVISHCIGFLAVKICEQSLQKESGRLSWIFPAVSWSGRSPSRSPPLLASPASSFSSPTRATASPCAPSGGPTTLEEEARAHRDSPVSNCYCFYRECKSV